MKYIYKHTLKESVFYFKNTCTKKTVVIARLAVFVK